MHQPQSSTLMSLLKHKTEALHQRLEKLPFFTALSVGILPFASYVNQLAAFATVFGTLEYETAASHNPSLRAIVNTNESRFSQLLHDLEYFGDKMIPKEFDVKRHAVAMAAKIRFLAVEDPVSLVGYEYVLKGTILGNRVHLPDIQRSFNVQGTHGAEFYAGFGERTDEHWGVFSTLMNSIDSKDGAAERIVAAAREAFSCLEDIHSALYPLPSGESQVITSTSLNPEAGNHAVPTDEREITAAIIAGRLCREEFPYFDVRYGERGKRFADSDAAWLATLATLTPPQIITQVSWLGGVLASRGMPRITLERQLFHLHKELLKTVPGKRTDYDKLLNAVTWLKTERLRHISAETFDTLCHFFTVSSRNESEGELKGTGSLIVSAVSDEKAGIVGAVTSIEAWLTDSERFGIDWISAVRETISLARSAAV